MICSETPKSDRDLCLNRGRTLGLEVDVQRELSRRRGDSNRIL
jgi:hypothetical protein